MIPTDHEYPRLRTGIEPIPVSDGPDPRIALHDPSGLAEGIVTLSLPAFILVQMFDGRNRFLDIQAAFAQASGRLLLSDELGSLISQLGEAGFLDSPRFEVRYASAVEKYRASGLRRMRAVVGAGQDGRPVVEEIDSILNEASPSAGGGRLVGMIAPHLDWARGRPCYARAYAALASERRVRRVVILGTNHFGRSTSAVATANDFETPLGRFPVDRDFIDNLEQRLGQTLRRHEFDHGAEHSIELQLPFISRIAGSNGCSLVPVLCPDPCGATGTAPFDGQGPDLKAFATALREAIREDATETLIIAAADLSHIGRQFGDEGPLTPERLREVASVDLSVLESLERSGAEAFRKHLENTGNPTRICSAGCIYAAVAVLEGAVIQRLHYHQAADDATQTCVTCTAYAIREAS